MSLRDQALDWRWMENDIDPIASVASNGEDLLRLLKELLGHDLTESPSKAQNNQEIALLNKIIKIVSRPSVDSAGLALKFSISLMSFKRSLIYSIRSGRD